MKDFGELLLEYLIDWIDDGEVERTAGQTTLFMPFTTQLEAVLQHPKSFFIAVIPPFASSAAVAILFQTAMFSSQFALVIRPQSPSASPKNSPF